MNAGSIDLMSDEVKAPSRRYRSVRRAEQAAGTRHRILAAARALFTEQGYTATSVAQIADRAGVAVDTIYVAVGRKPGLLRELIETALSGSDEVVPAEQRDYVRRIRAAGTAGEKLAIYAEAVVTIGRRMAPIHRALAEAAMRDPQCAALRSEISARRAANMLLFAADLRATAELRVTLTDDEVADVIWSMNSAEYYALLVGERGWSAERFERWLVDAWTRTLLVPEDGRRAR